MYDFVISLGQWNMLIIRTAQAYYISITTEASYALQLIISYLATEIVHQYQSK